MTPSAAAHQRRPCASKYAYKSGGWERCQTAGRVLFISTTTESTSSIPSPRRTWSVLQSVRVNGLQSCIRLCTIGRTARNIGRTNTDKVSPYSKIGYSSGLSFLDRYKSALSNLHWLRTLLATHTVGCPPKEFWNRVHELTHLRDEITQRTFPTER